MSLLELESVQAIWCQNLNAQFRCRPEFPHRVDGQQQADGASLLDAEASAGHLSPAICATFSSRTLLNVCFGWRQTSSAEDGHHHPPGPAAPPDCRPSLDWGQMQHLPSRNAAMQAPSCCSRVRVARATSRATDTGLPPAAMQARASFAPGSLHSQGPGNNPAPCNGSRARACCTAAVALRWRHL